mmetsp:Transcript_27565/g.72467  ORF Transcript_27565/g.72467 Transcript_27565/m.72467 type:complete len:250 (-) Transcript_27565:43-792(-)
MRTIFSNVCFTLVSGLAQGLDISTCQSLAQPDTSCATYITQKSIPNLAFTNPPGWNENGFTTYIIQDGKYMAYYTNVVSKPALALCEGVLSPDAYAAVQDKLNFPFDQAWYENRYGVTLDSQPDSQILTEYMAHYKAQSNCASMLSAMLPCLCIYPPIAKVLQSNVDAAIKAGKPVVTDSKAVNWLIDNASSGSTCSTIQAALNTLGAGSVDAANYATSFRYELDFFNQSPITSVTRVSQDRMALPVNF